MTSPSLRKHRTTRWNILPTLTSDILCRFRLAAALSFAAVSFSGACEFAAADEPAVETSAPAAAVGRATYSEAPVLEEVALAPLQPVPSSDIGRAAFNGALPPKPAAPVALPKSGPESRETAVNTRELSRALMNDLRAGRVSATVPAAPAEQAVVGGDRIAATPPMSKSTADDAGRATLSNNEQSMHVNDIFLISGDDADLAGVLTIPDFLQEDFELDEVPGSDPGSDPGVEQAGRRQMHNGCLTQNEGCGPSRKELKKSRRQTRIRRAVGGAQDRISRWSGGLIQFTNPDFEECFDPDDYNMPILLVADSEVAEPEEEDDRDEDTDKARPSVLARKLTDIKPTLSYAWGNKPQLLPDDFFDHMDEGVYEPVVAPRTVMQWAPSNLWYYPLYFQDPGLERYGHTRHPLVQPFVSSGRFFGQVVALPYQMTLHPPHCPEYALGYYQPGEWAPQKRYTIPFNEEAATIELVWIAGLILLMP
ncbi:MAG: hypothetical protein KDA89_02530 [Planctomycetaceae bacterium]|nr:hypothetical protein [Planctomycetaceae bacterium]